jgi:6-phospho-3-hexuloisomerase
MTDLTDLIDTVLEEIRGVLAKVERAQVSAVAEKLYDAGHVVVTGEGRSGFMAKAFAMRLMHLGLSVHVAGETTTPAVTGADTLVAVSGSGTTAGTVRTAQKAHDLGATVLAVTTDPESPLAAAADQLLVLPAATKYRRADEAPTIQPLSSLFDQTTHVVLDVVCLELAQRRGVDNAGAFRAHANTE